MRVLLLFVLLLCCAGVSLAQDVDQDDVIRTETDVTNLPFTATDKDHHFVTTLRAEDLRVLEDGVPQTLFTFQQETDRPLSIAFLIDVSFSQESTLPEQKAAVRTFIEKVIRSNKDQVALIPFTGLAYLEQPLTRDMLSVYRVLQTIEVAEGAYTGSGRPLTGIPTGPGLAGPPREASTAIWDAVGLTSTNVLANAAGQRRRAIILLTDGLNTSSRLSQKQAIDRVLGAEAVVYVIGIGSERDGLDRVALKDVAQHTGGRAFFPDKKFDLDAAFAEIEKELRTQYLIAYSSTNKKRDGSSENHDRAHQSGVEKRKTRDPPPPRLLRQVGFFNAKTQRRKDAKAGQMLRAGLCVFAPLRLCVEKDLDRTTPAALQKALSS